MVKRRHRERHARLALAVHAELEWFADRPAVDNHARPHRTAAEGQEGDRGAERSTY